ncbi:MAG TPA: cobyric acid synthase CobQ, partial [Stellaceae bacterium]|nr:cobyric acid synthase CobQ [Stellaceae bacterium]
LLDVETMMGREKILTEVEGRDSLFGAPVHGYEMHIGRTTGSGTARPFLDLGGRPDGALSPDGRVAGCHLHGLFVSDHFRRAYLARLGARGDETLHFERRIEATLEALADHLEAHLDLEALLEIAHAR